MRSAYVMLCVCQKRLTYHALEFSELRSITVYLRDYQQYVHTRFYHVRDCAS